MPIAKEPAPKTGPLWPRLLPLFALVLLTITVFALDIDRYLHIETLKNHHKHLSDWVNDAGFLGIGAYLVVYISVVLTSIPGPILLTLMGGFLFGPTLGTFLTVVGATTGATIVFLAARYAFGGSLQNRAGPIVQKMEAGFRRNSLTYLLILRLVPLFPFGAVNLAAAIFQVKLKTFLIATAFGIIPAVFVGSFFGAGMEELLQTNEALSFTSIFTPKIIAALLGLAGLVSAPAIYKNIFRRMEN